MHQNSNAYEPPVFIGDERYGFAELLKECCIPGYSLINGYYWDKAVADNNGISHQQAFSSNLPDYLSLEFFKTSMIAACAASYYLFQ